MIFIHVFIILFWSFYIFESYDFRLRKVLNFDFGITLQIMIWDLVAAYSLNHIIYWIFVIKSEFIGNHIQATIILICRLDLSEKFCANCRPLQHLVSKSHKIWFNVNMFICGGLEFKRRERMLESDLGVFEGQAALQIHHIRRFERSVGA